MQGEEVLVPFPESMAQHPVVLRFRSTLLVSSAQALQKRGHHERYLAQLSAEQRDAMTSLVAGVWVPAETAIIHYGACDRLGLSSQEQLDLGADVVQMLQRTFIGTVLKLANTSAGVTPWVGLQKFAAIHGRMFDGGGACVVQTGPKDARVEIVGQPLASNGYFRTAYRGFIRAGCEFFAKRVFVNEPRVSSVSMLVYRVSWA